MQSLNQSTAQPINRLAFPEVAGLKDGKVTKKTIVRHEHVGLSSLYFAILFSDDV